MDSDDRPVPLRTNRDGRAYPIPHNVYSVFRDHDLWRGVLRYNALTEMDEYHGEPNDPLGLVAGKTRKTVEIDDDIAFRARIWLDTAVSWTRPPGKELVYDALSAAAQTALYHPVREYLAPLAAEWDGNARLDTWLVDYCGAHDTDFVRAAGAKTLIAAAARALEPGCKVDTMLVLVGAQGIRKSSAIRVLGRHQWSSDTPVEIGHKDGYESIRGAWLIEMAELAGMSGKDVERLKAYYSSPVDVYRPPYGRKVVRRKRTCVFIGSTNSIDFLKDSSGARRFWCVLVGMIDVDGLESVVDQLWAEAALRYFQGEEWWLSPELAAMAEDEARAFTALDPWLERIENLIEDKTRIHTEDIFAALKLDPKDQHAGAAQRVVRIMTGQEIGWERPANGIKIGGVRKRGFRKAGLPYEDTFNDL